MPPILPPISALLHNCSLNCALPHIAAQIDVYANLSEAELQALQGTPVFTHYEALKDIFADVYQLSEVEKAAFNWQHLNALIKKHSFYGNEILFAPVLRAFVEKRMKEDYDTFDKFSAAYDEIIPPPEDADQIPGLRLIQNEVYQSFLAANKLCTNSCYPMLDEI